MINPIEDLGNMMSSQMKQIAKQNNGITVELGTITANMGLLVDSLVNAIPKGEYMVSFHLTIGSLNLNTSDVGLTVESVDLTTQTAEDHRHTINGHSHSIDAHAHTVTLPTQLRGLKAGDRVLVAWVGAEPIVVDIVVSS